MTKHKMPPLKEDISPNLVPMIDIMFLLLLFFLLGSDMARRESVDLLLPRADRIKEDKKTDEVPTTTINVHHDKLVSCPIAENENICRERTHWLWSVRGEDYTMETLKGRLQADADENPEKEIDKQAGKILSDRHLLVRGDRFAPYGDIQKIIETAGMVGMYKVEVAGAAPAPGAP